MTEHKVHRATVEYVSVVKFPYKKLEKMHKGVPKEIFECCQMEC